MTPQQRLCRLLTSLLLVAAAGVGYALWVTLTHLAIPCPFHAVTGLWCPGCGMTRMCLSLLRLDFAGAWQANPVLLVLLLPIAALLLYRMACYVRQGHTPAKPWETLVWSGLAVVLVIWGIVRNMV